MKREFNDMKKIMIGLLAVIMTMSICACGNDTNTSSKESTAKSSASASNDSSNKKELIYDSTEDFGYAEVDGGIIITDFKNYDYVEYDKIIVPSEIDGKKVVGIGNWDEQCHRVFGNCEVVIPSTVKHIAGMAFEGADGLVKLSGGENCTKIGKLCVYELRKLS